MTSIILISLLVSKLWVQEIKKKRMFPLNTVNSNVYFTHPDAAAASWLEK